MDKVIKLFATALGAGYSPVAPGTVGTIVGAFLFWAISGLPILPYIIFLVVFILFASWISDRAQVLFDEKDPSKIVIDEVAGILVTMVGHPWNWKIIIAGFILFRFFDIIKPFPIRRIEARLASGLGVVLDDVLAGIYANVCLILLVRYL